MMRLVACGFSQAVHDLQITEKIHSIGGNFSMIDPVIDVFWRVH